MMPPVKAIETRGLCKTFGGLMVADKVDFALEAGARHALIGPNGAGKTSLVNMLTGAIPPSAGKIYLSGEEVTHLSGAARVHRGLARTFQINTLFGELSALDNVALAIAERRGIAWRLWRAACRYREVHDECMILLESLGLAADASRRVADLDYGKQRLVEIAVALGLKPKVLLLDEPAAGVPSLESGRILDVLDALPAEVAILIIEHDMELVFRFAQRITVLVRGQILCQGTPDEIAADARVQEVYLGGEHG